MEAENIATIGNYKVVEVLRKTPEGALYNAVEKDSENRVLIKIYHPTLTWSEDLLDEFFNLVSHLRFIEHEHFLPILDFGKHEDLPYVVFGGGSTRLLDERHAPPTDRKELLSFFRKIADALDYLHKQEILHGSLNTENVVVDENGEPKLFDHGLSGVFKKLLTENLGEGFENLSISNLKCASPEQALGRNPTRASDVYSFGVVFYYYVFGKFPFDGRYAPETAVSLLESSTTKVDAIPPHVTGDVLKFIQKCIQLEPGARFSRFSQVTDVLDRMRSGKWTRFRFKKRIAAKRRVARRAWQYAAGFLVLAGLAAAYLLFPRGDGRQVVDSSPPPAESQPSPAPSQSIQAQTPGADQAPAGAPTSTSAPTGVSTESAPAQVVYKPAFEGATPSLPAEVISPSNVMEVVEISRLGYGKPEGADSSPDNQYFAVASSAGVFVFSGDRFEKWIDPQDWATSVQFSTNGDILAIGVNSGDIQLWDWKNEVVTTTLKGHKARISRLIFSSNDRLLYSASHDQHIIVWDLNRQGVIKDIAAHPVPVNDLAVSNDGRTLVSCADDQLIRIWDVASGAKIYELRFEGKPKAVAISSDDRYFAAGGDTGYVRQWSMVTAQSLTNAVPQLRTDPIPVKERIWSLEYTDNDTRLIVGMDDGNWKTYNPAQQKFPGVSLNFEIHPPLRNLVDVFGPKFEFGSRSVSFGGEVISLRWDGRVTVQQTEVVKPMYDILDRLDFSPDGTILASGGRRGTTNVWNLTTNRELYKSAYALPFGDPIAPDGSSIVIRQTETARVTITGEHIVDETYRQVALSGVSVVGDLSGAIPGAMVSYAREGSVFVSGNLNQSKTWDYLSGFETYSGGYPLTGCYVTTSDNDGEILQITSSAGILPRLDDRARNICARSLGATLPAFSGDLTLLVFINSNRLVEGFDTSSRQTLWTYRPERAVVVLAASPDGSIIVVGDESGRLTFLNGRDGGFIREIVGNFGALRAIKFSDDGAKLATAGDDGTTRLFGVPGSR